MADKLTQQITDALSRAAAGRAGLPLFAGKAEPGLFPSTAAARPAAQKCLADGLVRVVRTETRGKATRELYTLTEAGWEFLLAAVNPRQILEDFVRLLEARQGEVGELLTTARSMADSLQGLKDAVARVLPQVTVGRVREPLCRDAESSERSAPRLAGALAVGSRQSLDAVAVLEPPATTEAADLAGAVLARLTDWAASAAAGEDCPLPKLFHSLTTREPPPTVGAFHDCLRQLRADRAIHLHPWTGPLYAMPEPTYALLDGHNIAYYASLRDAGVRGAGVPAERVAGVRDDLDSAAPRFH